MANDGTEGPIPIRGIKAADPSRPPARLELRDMHKNHPDQWNLLLLGMQRFMDQDERNPLSFYQIAGIHGRPYDRPWPDAKWNEDEPVVQETGYCTHSSILFLTWHRPYLSLFETALHKHVTDIANEFSQQEDRDRYVKAAAEFRLPYWDWALPADDEVTIFPKEVLSTMIHKVYRPGGNNVPEDLTINPLASYSFKELGQSAISIHTENNAHRTHRGNLKNIGGQDELKFEKGLVDGRGDGNFIRMIRAKGKNLTERVLFILQGYTEFSPMSSNKFPGSGKWTGWGSLEDIHNSVHIYVSGHMGRTDTAAFDPVFWFHHCNIDRLFAIWQALHDDKSPESYVTDSEALEGSRLIPEDSVEKRSYETIKTPLAPFTKSTKRGDFYTSEEVRSTKTFGYVYPETRDWTVIGKKGISQKLQEIYARSSFANAVRETGQALKKSAAEFNARAVLHQQIATINEAGLQAPLSIQTFAMQKAEVKAQPQAPPTNIQEIALPAPIAEKVEAIRIEATQEKNSTGASGTNGGNNNSNNKPSTKFRDLLNDNKYLEWLIDVQVVKHSNSGNFLVHFFLGPPDDTSPQTYIYSHAHVATFSSFGQDSSTGCVKCQTDQSSKLLVTGQIPLTLALVERYIAGEEVGLDVESVESYLQRHLHWRVTDIYSSVILPRDSVQGLLVGVVTNEVTLPDSGNPADLPIYSPVVVPRPAATSRVDGSGRGDGTGYNGDILPGTV